MENRWTEADAAAQQTDLALRAYSSRLIGLDPALVLHGGGNTSAKSRATDHFGAERAIIWVKASGYDLGLMGTEGFTALELAPLRRLATLPELSDTDMVNEVARLRLDAAAAAPSIEAIVHAVIPAKFVDHSHADAVLTVSNSGQGRALFQRIYGDRVLVLPYVKPGFDLARQFARAEAEGLLAQHDTVILEHHGVFTYADSARTAYDRMIEVVDAAESFLVREYGRPLPHTNPPADPLSIARARAAASQLAGTALLSLPAGDLPPDSVAEVARMARHGTLTPEHVIHNKPFPAHLAADPAPGMDAFAADYAAYLNEAGDDVLVPLPPFPHWALWDSGHARSFGPNLKRAAVSRDVTVATLHALALAQRIGGWQGLSLDDLRDLEYWELEQAKLKRRGSDPRLAGKVAVVSGAAGGIGRACALELHRLGAVVHGLDIDPAVAEDMNRPGLHGSVIDLTDADAAARVLEDVVQGHGGIDILVSNAGIFRTGDTVEHMPAALWDQTLAVNLTAHQRLISAAVPYLRHGIEPAIVFIGSRNVAAPGAGAAAYSVSKAGLTQLMRVLALELAPEGIAVNAVHPDAVFDTRLWTDEALRRSAARYGMTVDEYKSRSLMGCEVTSHDVGLAVAALVDGTFPKTTGAQIPVDGGNLRVI